MLPDALRSPPLPPRHTHTCAPAPPHRRPPALMQQGCDWLRDWAPALQAAGQWPGGVQRCAWRTAPGWRAGVPQRGEPAKLLPLGGSCHPSDLPSPQAPARAAPPADLRNPAPPPLYCRWPFYVVVPNSLEFQSQGSNLLLQPPTPLPSVAAPPLEASLPSALSPSSSGHSRHSNPSTPWQRSAQQAAAGGRPPRAKRARSAAAAEPSGLDALLAAAASLERSDGGAAEAAASPAATPGAAEQLRGCPSRQPPRGSSWAAGAAAAALPPRSVGPAVARQQQQQLLQAAQSLLGYLNAHPAAAAPQPQPQPGQETVQQRKRKEPPAAACSAGAEPSLDAQQGIPSWPALAGE